MSYIHSEDEIAQGIEIPAWWTSPDLTHSDLEFKNGDKVFSITPHAHSQWNELGMAWPDQAPTETGNIVFADFKKDDTK